VIYDSAGVWIYISNISGWYLQGGRLDGLDTSGDKFTAISVSLSSSGSVLAVGKSNIEDNAFGATFIFVRNNNVWSQQGPKIFGSGAIGYSEQGYAVSLSGDGLTLAMSGPLNDYGIGAVWIFINNDNKWEEQNKLVGSDGDHSEQGTSISLSYNGSVLIVGGPGDSEKIGAIWIFNRSDDGTWTQQGSKLIGQNLDGCTFGQSVSISNNASLIAVGAPDYNHSNGALWLIFPGSPSDDSSTRNLSIGIILAISLTAALCVIVFIFSMRFYQKRQIKTDEEKEQPLIQ